MKFYKSFFPVFSLALAIAFFLFGSLLATSISARAEAYPTVFNDVDYSAVYDFDFYLNHYPELRNSYGDDSAGALEYFVTYGMDYRHHASKSFEVFAYIAQNPDLRRLYGNNFRDYYSHYILNGQSEGRPATGSYDYVDPVTKMEGIDFSDIYDYEYYVSRYKDVKKAVGVDDSKALDHFMRYGIFEGRMAKEGIYYHYPLYRMIKQDVEDVLAKKAEEEHQREIERQQAIEEEKDKYPLAVNALAGSTDLRRAFEIAYSIPYFGHNAEMPSEPIWSIEEFAEYGFVNGKGNCFVMAAMFYEMAKVLGYEPHQMSGSVRSRRGGWTPHSWIEMEVDGVNYVFDPNFTNETGRNGYMIQYEQTGTWMYHDWSPMPEQE